MQFDKLLGQCQPKSSPFFLVSIVAPHLAKFLEDRCLILRGNPDPGVTDRDFYRAVGLPGLSSIRPPSGVNFTALERRLRRICLILRSSPTKSPSRSSTATSRLMPCLVARSRTKVRALSIAKGRSNVASFQLHPPSFYFGKIQDLID